MKKIVTLCLLFVLQYAVVQAQSSNTFVVNGDLDKFYPVVFKDGNWFNNVATELEIGRSNTHADGDWRGSLISKFRFHCTLWGNGSSFVDLEMQGQNGVGGKLVPFIAGYRDASSGNVNLDLIIWLRGQTTYSYKSNTDQTPLIYDGVQKPLPFQEVNGPAHNYKTAVDSYINSVGKSSTGTLYTHDSGLNYMAGNLGLGTLDTKGYKLAVNGKILASEIKVEASLWPDYVFHQDYQLMSLPELEAYIKQNNHLPDMPSAQKAEKEGIDVGEMNKLLLKRLEETTLQLIELNKKMEIQNKRTERQNEVIAVQNKKINSLAAKIRLSKLKSN
ncbi:hypothetical protein HDF26_003816 [Pedobacter cryoconitis]|uniref:hypothetical protein n=1 Tax=Pedobacter cryoconitis TaxID=188932 RepID=UPI001617F050|nr:hypothetical protein [Pedobacter cryoconitis]MBB6273356.1 hypothetical protein [Pedobacter cryoconitis]